MRRYSVHPMTRLVIWLLFLIAVQSLNGILLVAPFLLLPSLGKAVMRRAALLIWRTRWLLVSLLVIFSWGVVGMPLWNGPAAPTREGLMEALTHLGRLVLVLIAVAAFLEAMPLPALLAATHGVLTPFRRFGLDPDRGVVRLMLVLRYVETLPRPRDWRTLLVVPESTFDEQIEMNHQPLLWIDILLMIAAMVLVMFLMFNGLSA